MTDSVDLELVAPAKLVAIVAEAPDVDPLPDSDELIKNRARVGSLRPTALLYTSGIGATVDLPHISVVVRGLEAWDHIYRRRSKAVLVHETRLLNAVQSQLGPSVKELRLPPWQQGDVGQHEAAPDLGVPVAVFPQWLRCTGCGELAPVTESVFEFVNTNPYRPDQARFQHKNCPGPGRKKGASASPSRTGRQPRPALPARYLLACENGHIDEFPYAQWVHHASGGQGTCPKAKHPRLRMYEQQSNMGPSATIACIPCDETRGMREATSKGAEDKLPKCRGRHPHLGIFQECGLPTKLMLLGSANQWFPATIGLLVLPTLAKPSVSDLAEVLRSVPPSNLAMIASVEQVKFLRMLTDGFGLDLGDSDDDAVWEAIGVLNGTGSQDQTAAITEFDPVALLVPEWDVLSEPREFAKVSENSDFKLRDMGQPPKLAPAVSSLVAVDRLKKVNAFIGFTRIDSEDRIGDNRQRLAPIARAAQPTWVPATEDRGEGVFLQFDEELVNQWEQQVLLSGAWAAHKAAHQRNFDRRRSKTSGAEVSADTRFKPPRYWALHTMSHLLIRKMAMYCGYGSASLTERIYAWGADSGRSAAAGILISTSAPDSEGTLGGLVALADQARMTELFIGALRTAQRCSSDPICARRLPEPPEEFLHGAACHFCAFASETSCERANRFLDRRFVIDLPGSDVTGLFQSLLT